MRCEKMMRLTDELVGPARAVWEARLLRFYILYLGLLSLFYVLWDIVDEWVAERDEATADSLS